jgi:protein-S-isoprenylcysteine O-methyltransferase Ste14
MFIRALIAFLALPGTVAYLIPLLLRPAYPLDEGWRPAGAVAVAVGSALLLWCTREFYVAGKGTLAPWAPPRELLSGGLYGLSRNPMYVAVVVVLLGWSIWFTSLVLLLYALGVACAFHLRIVFYEEPRLKEMFGDSWQIYRGRVPRWFLK